jgi:hypothetical protein
LKEKYIRRRTLGTGYDNEKGNWRILTNKEIYAIARKPTIPEKISLHRLHWFGALTENGRKSNSQKSIIYEFGNNKIER